MREGRLCWAPQKVPLGRLLKNLPATGPSREVCSGAQGGQMSSPGLLSKSLGEPLFGAGGGGASALEVFGVGATLVRPLGGGALPLHFPPNSSPGLPG